MNNNIKPIANLNLSAFDFQAQFKLCEQWNDPAQWDALAMLYVQGGYLLNARHCFERADACRQSMMQVRTDLGMGGDEIDLTLVRVAVETEA